MPNARLRLRLSEQVQVQELTADRDALGATYCQWRHGHLSRAGIAGQGDGVMRDLEDIDSSLNSFRGPSDISLDLRCEIGRWSSLATT